MIDGLNIPYMHIKPPCKVKDLATAGRCSAKGVMRHVPRSVHHMYNAVVHRVQSYCPHSSCTIP